MDNNNLLNNDGGKNSQIGLVSAHGTTFWPIRVFAFFMACTEVNVYLTLKYLLMTDEILDNQDKALIKNVYIND